MANEPVIAVTMGDPCGIGPEVVVKAASVAPIRRAARIKIFGDWSLLERTARELGLQVPLVQASGGSDADEVLVESGPELEGHAWGQPSPSTDAAQLAYIEAACQALEADTVGAVVTAPISKTSIHRAGSPFSGHTDLLGARFGGGRPVMMLAGPSLKVIPLTVHVPLTEVPSLVTADGLRHAIRVADACFRRDFGIPRPRIAVAGLNPHAGEGGMFGLEEQTTLVPAIQAEQKAGIEVRGPFPADTVFHRATRGEFEVVIGMYHDQALTPLKLLDFDRAVNVTLGLPIIRTSVDHGTAYDIAGQGVASAQSMVEALSLATRMVRTRSDEQA
ncbi:MAG: 4-hydroxythreonine-4-phosphate dehydrogenase PdxA [Myxococcota bacterium]